MWIETDRETLVRLSTPEIDEVVEFSENGTAQVSEEVAIALIDEYDCINELEE